MLIVIAGPTASGKTAAAIEVARHFETVVVSADSRQFYREMSIGTAKPNAQELAAVKHYFINTLSITENYTAGKYEKQALALLNELFKAHRVVVLAGGSGLFIKAVCEGFDEFPDIDPKIRQRLNQELENQGLLYLQEKLKIADPDYYAQADINNPQRVARALEVFEGTGKPFSSFRTSAVNKRPFRILKFGLNLPREVLYYRINSRVDVMVKDGLVEEVQSLLPYRHLNALNTVGYTELFDYFDGKTDLSTAIELIKQNTRRFAKRQITWFGRDTEIGWVDATAAAKEIIKRTN
ncbi:tRNA (adenosine(37)-N6)-dimethylallyltransferase MiaA [Mucilaginibacter sp. L3T2-6]|uniref:tRNA (adenosine(37)-N6)-dimethylallyltransferase MiaA n=1 Tax=Mucilaginibacter sp. L3T2-6 TaxID=3062491 RepID=UPI0026757C77|nr:tRNA (adenosine(37)-N6)-dimethylallyltransferase MiaA [Mucilaginibacter sp. L3T2-6]MDO3642704.1 tRNA (adenosine(37)-N6)-dimethylallyltransferase MiaA [Mucilaginibacter sp. L3T2-6]MDV6215353.1 tRNA (adenosine(37)-N6)-dimethylallyltransferase MiaA [Mucilaginibacter sp. L3T2-6]